MIQRSPSELRPVPWLVAVGFFMQTLDSTILHTALPTLAQELGESPLRMQSVVVSYMLTVALLIPASGWLADRFGPRKIFFQAIVLFTIGSLLCGISRDLTQLVASRVIQGLGGALLLPVGRLTIIRVFPKDQLLRVLSFVTIPGLIGPLLGPALGGWLVEYAHWRWIFFINLPVGAVGGLCTLLWMPALPTIKTNFDFRGFFLFTTGVLLLSLALQSIAEQILAPIQALLLLSCGAAAVAAYWVYSTRCPAPLFHRDLWKIPTFTLGAWGNFFSRLGSGAMPFLTPLFLQLALQFSPSHAGLFMIPTVIGAMIAKLLIEPLIRRLGYRRMLMGNTLLLGLLIASFSSIGPQTPFWQLITLLSAFGVINSLQFTAMNTFTLGDLDAKTASSGNSLLSVIMQLSMSIGVAIAASLLQVFSPEGRSTQDQQALLSAFHSTYLCVGALCVCSLFLFSQIAAQDGAARS